MKKIGIVSCYFQHNYGSMLQAYATQMALDKIGVENETIDISGFYNEIKIAKIKYFIKATLNSDILLSKKGMLKNVIIKKVIKNDYVVKSKIRNEKFDSFSKRYFKLSEVYYSKKNMSEKCNEKYSALLVGSDQLWLPANIAADYYTLSFVPEEVNTIAYATSFGQSSLPKDSAKKASIFLKRIKHIGVREESGQKLIETLTGRKVPVVCDPTLLFTGEEWLKVQEKEPIIKEPYIFCYFLGNNPLHREYAKRLRSETNCKIVALTHLDEYIKYDDTYADDTPYDIDPLDFLNLVRNASYVCTDSFHCTVFSVLYQREFFTFKRYKDETKLSTNSRIETLFNILGISERVMNGDENIHECIEMKIDYNSVHTKLEAIRKTSYEYLIASIKNKESTDCD